MKKLYFIKVALLLQADITAELRSFYHTSTHVTQKSFLKHGFLSKLTERDREESSVNSKCVFPSDDISLSTGITVHLI